jgi:hypothetical protein
MSSDDSQRRSDRAFTQPGVGMTPIFRCARCDKRSGAIGSGVRLVLGMRGRVCALCKEFIDARKAKA